MLVLQLNFTLFLSIPKYRQVSVSRRGKGVGADSRINGRRGRAREESETWTEDGDAEDKDTCSDGRGGLAWIDATSEKSEPVRQEEEAQRVSSRQEGRGGDDDGERGVIGHHPEVRRVTLVSLGRSSCVHLRVSTFDCAWQHHSRDGCRRCSDGMVLSAGGQQLKFTAVLLPSLKEILFDSAATGVGGILVEAVGDAHCRCHTGWRFVV